MLHEQRDRMLATKMMYRNTFPMVILVILIGRLARISPKAMVIPEPMMGRKAKNPAQAPFPFMNF